jgi:hypothetical protein
MNADQKPLYSGSYCGCCGRMCGSGDWCDDCRPHLLAGNLPPWEKTYFARYRSECPFTPPVGSPDSAWDARSVPVSVRDDNRELSS